RLSLLLHIRCPPSAPLFPYTTLFRSVANRLGRILGALVDRSGGGGAFQDVRPVAAHPRPRKAALPERQPPGAAYQAYAHDSDAIDRKSTRLNSSHDQISYAVFCLKKK